MFTRHVDRRGAVLESGERKWTRYTRKCSSYKLYNIDQTSNAPSHSTAAPVIPISMENPGRLEQQWCITSFNTLFDSRLLLLCPNEPTSAKMANAEDTGTVTRKGVCSWYKYSAHGAFL